MRRPWLALMLLAGLPIPGAAQDTESLRAAAKSAGFAAGLARWPTELYCSGDASAAAQALAPRELLERLQLAARCGVRMVIIPPRRFLTTNGRVEGVFSVEKAEALMDQYAAELPPDTLQKYRRTILGFNLGDDYGCTRCWGGAPVTQSQIIEWAKYTRAKLPGVPLGVRVTPKWVEEDPALAPLLDYTWAQYHARKGEAQSFYDNAASAAERLGLRVIMGVNVQDCYGSKTKACSPEDLIRMGMLAVKHPASCAFISWRFDERTWERPEIRQAWKQLLATAMERRAEDCRRPVAKG